MRGTDKKNLSDELMKWIEEKELNFKDARHVLNFTYARVAKLQKETSSESEATNEAPTETPNENQ
jgi:hypothetical protein